MTAEEREQVVELLRCAADVDSIGDAHDHIYGRGGAGTYYDVWSHAVFLRKSAKRPGMDYRTACLEAAQRVEEGSWP